MNTLLKALVWVVTLPIRIGLAAATDPVFYRPNKEEREFQVKLMLWPFKK